MSRVLLISLFVGVLGTPAWAQHGMGGFPPDGEGYMGAGMDHSVSAGRMYTRMGDQLDLDEAQRQQFDEIVAAQRERWSGMGQRWREVRQAMRDGDDQRAAELRAELRAGYAPGSGMSAIFDEIEPILRDDQVGKLWEMQDRMQSRREGFERYRRVVRELPDELDLDDGQQAEFERLLTSQREQMHERWSEMRPLFEEMRAAQEAGDEERLKELRKQLEEARPDPETMFDFDAVFEQLAEVLSDEQKERLAAFRAGAETGDDGERGPRDVRDVLRVLRRVRLSSTQKDEIRDIEREAIRARRDIGRRDKEGQARLAATVKAEIVTLLDQEQTKQFELLLRRYSRRNPSR